MAGYLRYLQGLCVGGVLGVIVVPALAQMSDPTRPAVNESATNAANENAAAPAAGLQTIIRRKAGKPAAIINGKYVELGGRVGESRLTVIGEDSVVLSGPSGKETLVLTPGIEKKTITPKAGNNVSSKSARKVRKHMRN